MENNSYWSSYRLPDGKLRWFLTNDDIIKIIDKNWFNKNTDDIIIHSGYETEEYSTKPVSDKIYKITINYVITNYFGDRSGLHCRSKNYILDNDKLYKQENGKGIEVKRLTKELRGILEELQNYEK